MAMHKLLPTKKKCFKAFLALFRLQRYCFFIVYANNFYFLGFFFVSFKKNT